MAVIYFWDDPGSRMVIIDLVGDQILLQPSAIDRLLEEGWKRPIVVTVPRSLDVESLGRMARAMLSLSISVNTEPRPDPREHLPEVEIDESELPEFLGGTWVPPPLEPPTEEELARWEAEERLATWPQVLKDRLAGVSTSVEYARNSLSCWLLELRGQIQITPCIKPDRYELDGFDSEKQAILLEEHAAEAELGTAIRSALERARNPWLPFLELFRAAKEKKPAPPEDHPLRLEPEWVPLNLSFIHGETVDRKQFWDLIRTTRPTPYIGGQHRGNLTGALGELDPKQIASFEKHYLDLADELYDARVVEVMWILSGGGPGDEGWSLFTSWLISQGKKKFQAVLDAPERIPELFPPGTEIYGDGIGIGHLARNVYEESTGRDDFDEFYAAIYGDYQFPAAPKGAKKDPRSEPEEVLEKRLRAKYPDLWQYEGHFD